MAKIEAATGPAFDDRAESAFDWVRAHAKFIGIAAVIVALVVLSWVFYRQYQNSQAAQAESHVEPLLVARVGSPATVHDFCACSGPSFGQRAPAKTGCGS